MPSTAVPRPGTVLHTACRAAAQTGLVHAPWHTRGFPLWRGLNLKFLDLPTPYWEETFILDVFSIRQSEDLFALTSLRYLLPAAPQSTCSTWMVLGVTSEHSSSQ